MSLKFCNWLFLLVVPAVLFFLPEIVFAADVVSSEGIAAESLPSEGFAWWVWVLLLFVFSFFLGIIAVVAGVGGGVLYVPIVSSLFPFHLDFVRGAGLMVALAGALSAGAPLLNKGLANLRLALSMALIGSISSIFGALVGLALPAHIIQLSLGFTIVFIAIIMLMAKKSEFPEISAPDKLSQILHIHGIYYEASLNKDIDWQIHRTPVGLVLFVIIGFMAGMFGLGAGWANVPVFNLVLGAPLKVSVATSVFVLSVNDTAAAWIYLHKGAVLPLIAVPSIAGMMLGTKIGAKLLTRVKTKSVRVIVITLLLLAGFRAILKGFGI
ncbi:MAG: sulfite exporter TauE/SafE family protein [Chlorobium phaeobacteroides]|uniref:Probable membrane transporter protein n=1 Tax=Chlorobium phaeobacteroides (strain BS1) TaxID=331678 RepID=B3ELH1_CHLPB|nr:sulfite exporter TauE/SafE family protein [Chlorobium phaeobacteroides]MBL6956102.1 sulfite exporter TauE/SafE family protein [Chlorobium phaeobacteroides]NEX13665.1 sulfite exporter TauE/SafE family protein [Prosthecochloris sp.]